MSVQHMRDTALVDKLVERNGKPTIAVFDDGEEHVFYDVTYGYDLGAKYAHVYTNIDSKVEGATIEFFYTTELMAVLDGETRTPLFSFPI